MINLWHMIMSGTRGTGAYMFSTKCNGSFSVINVRNSFKKRPFLLSAAL